MAGPKDTQASGDWETTVIRQSRENVQKSPKQVHREFSDTLLLKNPGQYTQTKTLTQILNSCVMLGKHFPSLGFLCCYFPSEAADCPSSSNTVIVRHQCREHWSVTIMPATAVSTHSHHKGRLKFLEETERGLALIS